MYPTRIRLNEPTAARRRVPIWLVDVTDGLTAETGVAGKPNLSVLGAVPAGTVNNITEINAGGMPGLYYIELDATEVVTVGTSFLSFKTAATAQWHGSFEIYEEPWNALTANYTAAGSFGLLQQTIAVNTQPAATASTIWTALKASYTTPGTFGASIQDTETAIEHLSGSGVKG